MPEPRRRVAVAAPPKPAEGRADREHVAASCLRGDGVCPCLHEAVELVGKRWSGAILAVLLARGPLRFSQIGQAVPELSDRLLSERMKELEARGLIERTVHGGTPVRVEYGLTAMGLDLAPVFGALKAWGSRWLDD